MKKVFIILVVLSLLFISACKGEGEINNTTAVETTTEESITTSIPTSEELEIWGSQELWELGQKNMKVLSEKFDFDDEYLKDFALTLSEAGVKEIKEITVEEVGEKSEIVRMKDITDGVYYILFGEYHRGNVCTEEEWMMAEKNKSVISENLDLGERKSESISEILAKSGVQEIVSLDIEEEEYEGYYITIEDITGTVYCAAIHNGYVSMVIKGVWGDGEVVYESMGGEELIMPTET